MNSVQARPERQNAITGTVRSAQMAPFMIHIASDASAAGCVPLSITEPPR
jgi:hypothetical protein